MIDVSRADGNLAAERPASAAGKTRNLAAGQPPADRSLDQWRGLALVLVLISHGFHYPKDWVPGIGRVGVNLFFFISGILVFRSLARGPQEPFAGARFFLERRIKRLIPAKYFYLAGMALLVLIASARLTPPDFRESFFRCLPSSFLYYRNYFTLPFSARSPFTGMPENLTGHLWSLACEMQFYLLAPLIYFAGGPTRNRRLAVWSVVFGLLLLGGLSVLGKPDHSYDPYTFTAAVWPMMAGFFAEFLRVSFPRYSAAWASPLLGVGVVALLALPIAMLLMRKQLVVLAGTPLIAGCLGCYLKSMAPKGFAGNAFHFLGNRTYSIYLWQQPLTIGGLMPPPLHPLGSLFSVLVGSLSFRYLERPFMSKYKKVPAASPVTPT